MYTYTQWSSKVKISLPVPPDTTSQDVKVELTRTSCSIGLRGAAAPLLKGKLLRTIVPDESDWRLVPSDTHPAGRASRSSSSERAGEPSGPGSGSSEGGPSSDLASSTSSLVKIPGAHSKAQSQASDDSSPVLIEAPNSFGSSPSPPAGEARRLPSASPSSPSPYTPASPTLFAEYRTSSTSSASEEGYSSPMGGHQKMLVVELMKEEVGEWQGGLIVVGPFERDGEAEEGWGGMDEISLVGLAMDRLGSGRRAEAEEMLSHLHTTNPFNRLTTSILTTYLFPPSLTPSTSPTLFPSTLLAQLYVHSAQHPSSLHTSAFPFPLPPLPHPVPTASTLVRAARAQDPSVAIPSDLEHLLTSPLKEKSASSPGSESSSTSSTSSPAGTTSRRRRSKPTSGSSTRRPIPGGVPGGGEGDWSVWVAVTLVGLVLVVVAVWPGKGKGKATGSTGGTGSGVGA